MVVKEGSVIEEAVEDVVRVNDSTVEHWCGVHMQHSPGCEGCRQSGPAASK